MTHDKSTETPLVIEAAICPYRPGPPVFDGEGMLLQSLECIDAGAAVIHHHHDMRMDAGAATNEMVTLGRAVKAARPGAVLYPDFLSGSSIDEFIGHVEPMAQAGAIDILPVDPGASYSGQFDDAGWPIGSNKIRFTFDHANSALRIAQKLDLPVTIGVFEPFQLRWALTHQAAGRLPAGSMVKLYFGGEYSLINIGQKALNFGLPPSCAALDAYLDMLEGSGLDWMAAVIGDAILDTPVARHAIERGGRIRVGIEDTAGCTDMTNRDTVAETCALAAQVGRPVASPGEFRRELKAKAGFAMDCGK